MSRRLRLVKSLPLLALGALVGCAGGTSTTDTAATAADALQTAQCDYQGFRAQADACFQAFDACRASVADDAAKQACRDTLQACLPPPPPGGPGGAGGPGHRGPPPDGGCDGQGPGGMGGPGGPGGLGGPPPDGGLRPDRPGMGPGRPQVDDAAVRACRDTLATCLAAPGADVKVCHDAERACVQGAFKAAFDAFCAQALTLCADPATAPPHCDRVAEKCAQGPVPPPDADGGLVCP